MNLEKKLNSNIIFKAMKITTNLHLLLKTKNLYQIPLARKLTLKLALLHQWFFSGLKVTDSHCGLRAISRNAAKKIMIIQDRMAHASEILDKIARHKLKFIEERIDKELILKLDS